MRIMLPARAEGEAVVVHHAPGPDEDPESTKDYFLEDLEKIAETFKERRIELGFTQKDAAKAIGKLTGNLNFSQTSVCRFEAMNLSHKNMCKMVPVMTGWLQEAENSLGCPTASSNSVDNSASAAGVLALRKKQWKPRTPIPKHVRSELEKEYLWNPRPSQVERGFIASRVSLQMKVVNTWFANRWQRNRRANPERGRASNKLPAASTASSAPEDPEV